MENKSDDKEQAVTVKEELVTDLANKGNDKTVEQEQTGPHNEPDDRGIDNINESANGENLTIAKEQAIENAEEGKEVVEEDEDIVSIDPAVIDKLTTGVLGLFLPNLQRARGTLNECLHNQEVLMETVQQENAKFTESTSMQQLINTMQGARLYHSKLVNLKKEMNILSERSAKIKRRAVRLQQQKQKEDLERAAQRDRETEKERMLAAKVAKDAK